MIVSTSIDGVFAHENECENGKVNIGFVISWVKDDGQFGEIRFTQSSYNDMTSQFIIDSEFMSREFVKEALSELVNSAYFPCESEDA